MEHWRKSFNPNYIGAYAFQPGEEKVVTIKATDNEEVTNQDGKKEQCLVAHFKEAEKPLILNVTNCKTIEKLAGTPDRLQWPGTGLILCVQKVKAFGEVVEAVRIRPVQPFICEKCNGFISGYGGRTHAEIRDYTRKNYGKQLCAACAQKEKEAKESGR